MFQQIISASLSPNTQADDVLLSFKNLLVPWRWKKGKAIEQVEQWFEAYFPGYHAVSFNSGRSAMLAILTAFTIGEGDEVLVQAFTCVAVPNSVLWAGATPIFADIDSTLNIDPDDVERKITKRTKAIIVQHTLGIPANMDALVAIANKHKLTLIEDCAHSLGATYKERKVGTFGDAAFFSFGRDKVVSSVFGGMAVIKSNLKSQISNLKQYHAKLPYPSHFWIFQQLLHPVAFSAILLLYDVIIGKILLVFLQTLRLLSFPVYPEEKRGSRPADFPAKFANSLAQLAFKQLSKLDAYNENRRAVASRYQKGLKDKKDITQIPSRDGSIFLRYPVLVPDPIKLRKQTKNCGILLGNWYHNVIDPSGVDYRVIGYRLGSCPKAEQAAGHIVNLPTRLSTVATNRVIAAL